MQINKTTFKTNILTDVAMDEIRNAFNADKRILSFNMEKAGNENLLYVSGKIESSETGAKINSLGYSHLPWCGAC